MRRSRKWLSNCGYAVSIHAPWEGCDHVGRYSKLSDDSFNSRTLGRVRHHLLIEVSLGYWFQFTHPGKGATMLSRHTSPTNSCFNSRTLGRVRRLPIKAFTQIYDVSIHAPWEGCDDRVFSVNFDGSEFQFTHPGKGATYPSLTKVGGKGRFNSRTLGRVRPHPRRSFDVTSEFQFTHPGKGATRFSGVSPLGILSFNSRTLGRVRLKLRSEEEFIREFQFTHPGKGATASAPPCALPAERFNSRTLGRVRRSRVYLAPTPT